MTPPSEAGPPPAHEALVQRVRGRPAPEICAVLEEMIRAGELRAGTQLPTIRAFASMAEVTVGSVLAVWNHLHELDLIETHRRGGTIVAAPVSGGMPDGRQGWSEIDFQASAPDTRLQPDLRDALLDSLSTVNLNEFGRESITPRLRDAVSRDWPFPPEALATAGGDTEALLLATAAAAPPGSLVAVDQPMSPGYLDTLRDLELTPIGVDGDADGPTAPSLRAALEQGAVAFVLQPGAAFALDHVLSPRRSAELAAVVRDFDGVWVIEDDSIGPLAEREPPTLGAGLEGRVLRVRSYGKALGIDLRTSVLGGSAELVERSARLRSHGVGSNSRILQNALAFLVTDPDAAAVVRHARQVYRDRKVALGTALERHGAVARSGARSLVLWVEVANETNAIVGLASKGVSVGAGSRSFASPRPGQVIRVSPLQLPDDPVAVEQLARWIAEAARGTIREFFD